MTRKVKSKLVCDCCESVLHSCSWCKKKFVDGDDAVCYDANDTYFHYCSDRCAIQGLTIEATVITEDA